MDPTIVATLGGELAALACLIWIVQYIFRSMIPKQNEEWRKVLREDRAAFRLELQADRAAAREDQREERVAFREVQAAINERLLDLTRAVASCPTKEE